MRTNKQHWPSILILITLGFSALLFLVITLAAGISSTIGLFTDGSDPAGKMIAAFAFGFEMTVLLICSWFVLQKTMRREQADLPIIFPFALWQIIAMIVTVIVSVVIGAVIAFTEITWLGWLILPVLSVLVIAPPLWLLFGIGTQGIELGPRWRIFGIFGLSMTVGPLIMIILEIILLLGVIIVGAIIIAVQNPILFQELTKLGKVLEQETNPEIILGMLAPYLTRPIVVTAILGYIAVLVPLIEELLKPLAVWIFATKIESPAQGFAMGVLSGGAFALLESLNASADGSSSWPIVVSVRAGTSLLHMTASGLVGWGIVSAFREKRIWRFFAAYFTAVTIHGIWNACAPGTGISSIGESIGKPEWLFHYIPALLSGMLVLGVGMFLVLIASNRKLRNIPAPLPGPLIESTGEGVQ